MKAVGYYYNVKAQILHIICLVGFVAILTNLGGAEGCFDLLAV